MDYNYVNYTIGFIIYDMYVYYWKNVSLILILMIVMLMDKLMNKIMLKLSSH